MKEMAILYAERDKVATDFDAKWDANKSSWDTIVFLAISYGKNTFKSQIRFEMLAESFTNNEGKKNCPYPYTWTFLLALVFHSHPYGLS